MIQNVHHEQQLYAPALDCTLPIYSTVGYTKVEAIFHYVYEGVPNKELLSHYSEGWIISAYKQLRNAECLADRWLNMPHKKLFEFGLDGLDDYSLAVYASVVQDRDEIETPEGGGSVRGWDRAVAAYFKLLKNIGGTDLLDYSWLYRDLLGYNMLPNDDAYWEHLERLVAFEVKWGRDDKIVEALGLLACDWIEAGRIEEGGHLLSRILKTQQISFGILESAAIAFRNVKRATTVQILLEFADKISQSNGVARHTYEDLVFMTKMYDVSETTSTTLDSKLSAAIHKSSPGSLSATELAVETIPHLHSINVKSIPSL